MTCASKLHTLSRRYDMIGSLVASVTTGGVVGISNSLFGLANAGIGTNFLLGFAIKT